MSVVSGGGSVRVICGPTATGKSALALRLAEQFGAGIISADSRQVYRGFDIGTAKPSPGDRASVRHYCIDVAAPDERYSAARWAAEAERAADDCAAGGLVPLVAGGTGFYMRALFSPLFQEPELDAVRLAALRQFLNELSTDELRKWCAVLDPALSHLGRTQLQRALEVSILAGERLSDMQMRKAPTPRWRARYLLVDSGAALHSSIEARVAEMFSDGWEAEVAALNATVPADAPAWKSTGYGEVRELLHGRVERSEAVRSIVVRTRQYAKRQRTWFRNQLRGERVTQLDGRSPDLFGQALEWWNKEEEE